MSTNEKPNEYSPSLQFAYTLHNTSRASMKTPSSKATTHPQQNGSQNAETPINLPFGHNGQTVDMVQFAQELREVVLDAIHAIHRSARKAITAGQALNEARSKVTQPRGRDGQFHPTDSDGFMEWLEKVVPEIPGRTARRWMEAARNILKALPASPDDAQKPNRPDYIDIEGIPISEVISRDANDLSDAARAWRQTWLDFTQSRTIKQCVEGLFLDDDDIASRRLRNAVNGLTARGAGGSGDRKDYPTFVARKLKEMTGHLVARANRRAAPHYRNIDGDQKTRIAMSLDNAICAWPKWLLESVRSAAARELKLSDVDRAAHLIESLKKVSKF